jgi:hypothetical protein
VSLSVTELQGLPPEEIDARVNAFLLAPLDYTNETGKQIGTHRARTVTALRLMNVWPASERARGGKA